MFGLALSILLKVSWKSPSGSATSRSDLASSIDLDISFDDFSRDVIVRDCVSDPRWFINDSKVSGKQQDANTFEYSCIKLYKKNTMHH